MVVKNIIDKYSGKLKIFTDAFGWTVVTPLAYLIRLDGNIDGYVSQIIAVTALLGAIKLLLVYLFKTHKQIWRSTSYAELFKLIKISAGVSAVFLLGTFLLRDIYPIPLSIPILDFLLSLCMLVTIRATVRFMVKYRVRNRMIHQEKKRILIAGAGESGTNVAREMLKHPDAGMLPVAFVDDDLSKHGHKINGISVAGSMRQMKKFVRQFNIDEVIIAMPSETGETIRKIVEFAQNAGVEHRIIPGLYDLVSGKVTINEIREVDMADLLRRKQVQLDTEKIQEYVKDRNILVAGAGGSIGSEIVRQLSRFQPARIILLGRGENSIFELLCKLRNDCNDLEIVPRICDIRDRDSLEYIFSCDRPDVIYHAAAHKHVPLMEQNPFQAILNNVKGTQNLVELALKYRVSHFVNISSDKAINPTSVMGASKRIAEHVIQQAASKIRDDKVFVSVRFGNVLGSRGSVIPIFKDQIKRGGPVTVTHPEMQRYFMTIPEASQLVLQAGALDQNGAVLLLDMGEPVKIVQMARDLIRLSGFEPDEDIEIKFTGIRPGEKMFEELATENEGFKRTDHEKIFIYRMNGTLPDLNNHLEFLYLAVKRRDKEQISQAIRTIVPSFRDKNAVLTQTA